MNDAVTDQATGRGTVLAERDCERAKGVKGWAGLRGVVFAVGQKVVEIDRAANRG